jgi:hypothetical protein
LLPLSLTRPFYGIGGDSGRSSSSNRARKMRETKNATREREGQLSSNEKAFELISLSKPSPTTANSNLLLKSGFIFRKEKNIHFLLHHPMLSSSFFFFCAIFFTIERVFHFWLTTILPLTINQ